MKSCAFGLSEQRSNQQKGAITTAVTSQKAEEKDNLLNRFGLHGLVYLRVGSDAEKMQINDGKDEQEASIIIARALDAPTSRPLKAIS